MYVIADYFVTNIIKLFNNTGNFRQNFYVYPYMKPKWKSKPYVTYFSPVDEYGNPVERTKQEYPYSYDGFVTYRNGQNDEITGTAWSDRLLQWDHEKTRNLMKKHFGGQGDYYYERTPEQIESFLSEYLGERVRLILIMEYCNASSGYPVWRFDFSSKSP